MQERIKTILQAPNFAEQINIKDLEQFSIDDFFFYDQAHPECLLAKAIASNCWIVLDKYKKLSQEKMDLNRPVNSSGVSFMWYLLGGGGVLIYQNQMNEQRENFIKSIAKDLLKDWDVNGGGPKDSNDPSYKVNNVWLLTFWEDKFFNLLQEVYRQKIAKDTNFQLELEAAPAHVKNWRYGVPAYWYLFKDKKDGFLDEKFLTNVNPNCAPSHPGIPNCSVDVTYLFLSSKRVELLRKIKANGNFLLNYNGGPTYYRLDKGTGAITSEHPDRGTTNLYLLTIMGLLDEFFVFTAGQKIKINAGPKSEKHSDFGVTVLYLWALIGRWDLITKGLNQGYFEETILDATAGPKQPIHLGYGIDFAYLAARAKQFSLLERIFHQLPSQFNLDSGPKNPSFSDFGYSLGYILIEEEQYGLFEKILLRSSKVNFLTQPAGKPCLGCLLLEKGQYSLLSKVLNEHLASNKLDLATPKALQNATSSESSRAAVHTPMHMSSDVSLQQSRILKGEGYMLGGFKSESFFPGLMQATENDPSGTLVKAFDDFFEKALIAESSIENKILCNFIVKQFKTEDLVELSAVVNGKNVRKFLAIELKDRPSKYLDSPKSPTVRLLASSGPRGSNSSNSMARLSFSARMNSAVGGGASAPATTPYVSSSTASSSTDPATYSRPPSSQTKF